MTSYTGYMRGLPLFIAGTQPPGHPYPMPPSSNTSTSATYTYSPTGLLSSETATTQTSPPSCLPPTPPAACPPPSQHSPAGPPPCLSKAIAANHFLYDGQYLDTTSGLYYLRARWYDPATGQFTSVDALVALTGEPYSYAGGNPVNGSDPSGLGAYPQIVLNLMSFFFGESSSAVNSQPKFVKRSILGNLMTIYSPVNTIVNDFNFWLAVSKSAGHSLSYADTSIWLKLALLVLWVGLYQPNPNQAPTQHTFNEFFGGKSCSSELQCFGMFYSDVRTSAVNWLNSYLNTTSTALFNFPDQSVEEVVYGIALQDARTHVLCLGHVNTNGIISSAIGIGIVGLLENM